MTLPVNLFICLLWILAAATPSQGVAAQEPDWSLETLMGEIAAIETRSSRFTETKEIALLSHSLTQTGTLRFQAPDKLSKWLDPPDGSAFEIDGDILTILSADKPPQVMSIDGNPQLLSLLAPFRSTLKGDLKALQRHYRVALEGERTSWRIELKPRDSIVARQISRIEIHGAGADVSRFVVLEQSGDRTITQLEPSAE